jgi:hypothetical protein
LSLPPPDLLGTLDYVAAEMSKELPDLSEAEIVVATIRLNLTALAQTLAEIGVMGSGLSNESLYGITQGIIESCEWMISKEAAWEGMSTIEAAANGEEI